MIKLTLTAIFAFALNLFLSAHAPYNDAPCNANSLSCGTPRAGTTVGATNSFISPSCIFGQTKDVFYEVYAQTEREYTVTVTGANYNPTLAAYTGSCDGVLTELACSTGIFGGPRTIYFSVPSNQFVLIQTFASFGNSGVFEIAIDCSQPVNNLPCDALPILCGETLSGNSTNAETAGIGTPTCSLPNGSIQDLFYTFDAGEGNTYTISVNGPNYDGLVALYSLGYPGNCNSGRTELACANTSPIPGVAETITFTATESKTILIQTYDWRAQAGGEFNISLTCEFPNDAPCDATEITCGQFTGGTTVGATQSSLGPTSCAFGSQKDVFYKIKAIAGIQYTVTVNGTNYDGILAAYTGSCSGTLTELDCSDNGTADNLIETIDFSVTINRTVYIRTYDYTSSGGDFGLQVTCANLPYDEPCDARILECDETFSGSSSGATTSSIGSPSCNGPYGRKDIFFKFYATANQDYSVTVNGANYNALIAAYTGSCSGTLTEIGCANNGSQNGIAETLNMNVSTNQYITLQVYDVITASATASDYTITLNCPIPDNDDCVDAITLPVNIPGECPANQIQGTTEGSTPSNPDGCEVSSPDVYYTFNSGSNSAVIINLDALTAEDLVLSLFESSCSSEPFICSYNIALTQVSVTPFTTYYVRVHTYSGLIKGSFNICIEEVLPEIATINGTITGWNTSCDERDATVKLYTPGTSALIAAYDVFIQGDGSFNIPEVEIGTFDVIVKVNGYLAKGIRNVVIEAGSNSLVMGELEFGDINNDNIVDFVDLGALSGVYLIPTGQPEYDAIADSNCDGIIDFVDLGALSGSYLAVGDSAPLLPSGY